MREKEGKGTEGKGGRKLANKDCEINQQSEETSGHKSVFSLRVFISS